MSPIDRAVIEARLRAQGLDPKTWSSPPGQRVAEGSNDYDKVVVVVEGSMTFGLSGYGVGFVLAPGERMDMPAKMPHDALAGANGVTYMEAHLPAGTVGHKAKGRGYRW